MTAVGGDPARGLPKGVCRCEARVAPAILDGYACGNPDCWRTAVVRAAFADFVETLKTRRGEASAQPSRSLPST